MTGSKITVDKATMDRARRVAAIAGYSSVDEFVGHLIEKELDKLDSSQNDAELVEKLKGLGYID
jgi:hypothetical protein